MPRPLLESTAAVVNDELYVFGGFTLKWQAVTDSYKYSPKDDKWTCLSQMQTPVTHVNSAVDQSKIWIAGGFVGNHPGTATDEVWCYDTTTDKWTSSVPLPEKRAGGGLALVDQTLHYFGGFSEDRETTHADHWMLQLDKECQWIESAPLPTPRGHISVAVVQGKIYALGGQTGHDINPIDRNSVYCFDCSKMQWSEIAKLPHPRSHFEAATCVVEDYIIVTGGRNNQDPVLLSHDWWDHRQEKLIDDMPLQLLLRAKSSPRITDVLCNVIVYDTKQNAWKEIFSLPTRLYGPVAQMVNKGFTVSGGGRIRHRFVETRTLLNETLIDLIDA
ncbi:MAG: kelch repeat-containing protein [Phormidesmis sp.]